jgi:hypothetical protein
VTWRSVTLTFSDICAVKDKTWCFATISLCDMTLCNCTIKTQSMPVVETTTETLVIYKNKCLICVYAMAGWTNESEAQLSQYVAFLTSGVSDVTQPLPIVFIHSTHHPPPPFLANILCTLVLSIGLESHPSTATSQSKFVSDSVVHSCSCAYSSRSFTSVFYVNVQFCPHKWYLMLQ